MLLKLHTQNRISLYHFSKLYEFATATVIMYSSTHKLLPITTFALILLLAKQFCLMLITVKSVEDGLIHSSILIKQIIIIRRHISVSK